MRGLSVGAAARTVQENYKLLLELREAAIAKLKPGVKVCDVHEAVSARLKRSKPELLPKLQKSLGFGIGLEFKESNMLLSEKSTKGIRPGMVF